MVLRTLAAQSSAPRDVTISASIPVDSIVRVKYSRVALQTRALKLPRSIPSCRANGVLLLPNCRLLPTPPTPTSTLLAISRSTYRIPYPSEGPHRLKIRTCSQTPKNGTISEQTPKLTLSKTRLGRGDAAQADKCGWTKRWIGEDGVFNGMQNRYHQARKHGG